MKHIPIKTGLSMTTHNSRNTLMIFFLTALALCISPFLAHAADENVKIVLKMATVAPKGHTMTKRMDELNEEVRKATGNEVMFKIYWGGVQGDDNNVFRKIRLGQLHGGFFSGYSLGHIVPEIRVTELPYLFSNDEEVKYVRDKLQATMFDHFDKKGFVVLGTFIDIGFMYLFYKEPVNSIDDMKKIRCWAPGEDSLAQAFFKSMGIQPVPLAISDVLTSVSANLIDSAGMTPFGAISFRWYTRFRYMSDMPMLNVVGANIVTKKAWETISPKSRQIILQIANRYCDRQKEDLRNANKQSMDLLRKEGVTILHIDPNKDAKRVKYLVDAGYAAREAVVGVLYSRELMNKTLSLVDEYSAKQGGRKNIKKF
jgi:TRAP-type C4-dicarboxylate transport system substrate-binding protein